MTSILATLDPCMHVIAAALYGAAFVAVVFDSGARLVRLQVIAGASGFSVHMAALAARWIVVGHGPYVSRYENLSAYALGTGALALYLAIRGRSDLKLGLVLYPASTILIGFAVYSGPEAHMLPPTFSGLWLVLHVTFYVLAFATALTALGASFLYVRSAARASRPADEDVLGVLDAAAYRFAGLAFALWGVGMLTGSIWAYHAWGRYWAWDPVETWSLVTWFAYGAYLHMRRFFALRGSRAAWFLLIAFVLALMSLFGTSLLSDSLHAVYFQ